MDFIKDFMLVTIEKCYNTSNLQLNQISEDAIAEFVSNPHTLLLQTYVTPEKELKMSAKIETGKNKSLVFYKTSAQDLTKPDALKHLSIMTLSDSPAESLYQLLKQIYSPIMAEGNDVLSSSIQQNLSDLESNLRMLTHSECDSKTFNIILTVEDEIDFWKSVVENKKSNKKDREASTNFCELFGVIQDEIGSLQSSPMSENREAVENIGGLLDDVWRSNMQAYPQDRMKHMFDVIGHTVCSIVQKSLTNEDIWTVHGDSKDGQVLLLLSDSLQVINTWNNACQSLTETYWPNDSIHPWNGKSFVPTYCLKFRTRLSEVLDVRSAHNQLSKLLTPSERQELKTDQMVEPFQRINVWSCTGTNQAWETAMAKFSANFKPAEVKIADKLKPRLHNTSTKQMLYEFMRYKSLIDRPSVKAALGSELQIFVTSLGSLLKGIQNDMENEVSSDADMYNMYQPPEMTGIVRQVQWAKQMEAKVTEIQSCAENYLKQFDGSNELIQLATKLLKELKTMYTQLHEDWCRDLQAQIKNGTLQLALDKPVVEFSSSNNMMVVNFNPRAVSISLEARGMSALGLPPPPAVTDALDTLGRLLHHARLLQQVSSFHNTLGERVTPSTRPMLLPAALRLSALVQDQKDVYWDNEQQVHNYAHKLKLAVYDLEQQNAYLTSEHVAIRNIVATLIDTELLSKQAEWKKKIQEIRDIIEKVESEGYRGTAAWRAHWDRQVHAALEAQYVTTLLSLHKHFPHASADLVLRGGSVRVEPPPEELRAHHYRALRRLIALPEHFAPLGGNITGRSIFATIVDKHSWLGNRSVAQLEVTLSGVERLCVEWTRRAALACVPDLRALCRDNLKEPRDWETNFKACKAYGQAVAKMTFEDEKIDWITVRTVGLRRELESQVRNLWGCLIATLQESCRDDAGTLDAFTASAMLLLENKALPKNAKELAELSAKQQTLKEKMPEMEAVMESLHRKSSLWRTWGGAGAGGAGAGAGGEDAARRWARLRELMLAHEQMFHHQAEIVKSSLSGEWENLNTGVEAWFSRWTHDRSRFEETHGVEYSEMADRCRLVFEALQQYDKFVAEKDDLMKECNKFNMDIAVSDIWREAETLMVQDKALWTPFKEFDKELQALGEGEWLVCQKKLHLLEEFLSKWRSATAGAAPPLTAVTLYIQHLLDNYSDLTPLLKYVRGSDFTERHWREVFALLQMEYKPPADLCLRDWLHVALSLKKHYKALQKISASASSEAAVRGALGELELWFASARFSLTHYRDRAKQAVPIVTEFKDIITKIEEQQWIVSSLGGAAGGAGGGALAGAWEARLGAALALARSLHATQRRSVLQPLYHH